MDLVNRLTESTTFSKENENSVLLHPISSDTISVDNEHKEEGGGDRTHLVNNGGEIGGDLVVIDGIASCSFVQTNAEEELERFLGVIVFENHGAETDQVTETTKREMRPFLGLMVWRRRGFTLTRYNRIIWSGYLNKSELIGAFG